MKPQTLYRARFVLPITASLIEDGAILVESGLIRAVGNYHDLSVAHPDASLVDFGEAVLLPPMVNAHTHLELSAFPKWAAAAGEPQAPLERITESQALLRSGIEEARRQGETHAAGEMSEFLASLGSLGK